MRTVLQQRGEPELTNFEWLRQKLFKRLSMNSALVEAQANTYMLGGSNGYMTARDWNRLGLLFVRDGVWVDNTRYFSPTWVTETKTPSPTNGGYGYHCGIGNSRGVPLFSMNGFRDQNVWMVQQKDLVVTRHSMPPLLGSDWSRSAFLDPIIAAFPDVEAK
jgi:CubicO group peptidase (beta-lactamase class C family)